MTNETTKKANTARPVRRSTIRAIGIFNTIDPFQVYEIGKGGWYDVINCRNGKAYRMGDRALNDALNHYGESVTIEHWELK